jgi:hypothetical protein
MKRRVLHRYSSACRYVLDKVLNSYSVHSDLSSSFLLWIATKTRRILFVCAFLCESYSVGLRPDYLAKGISCWAVENVPVEGVRVLLEAFRRNSEEAFPYDPCSYVCHVPGMLALKKLRCQNTNLTKKMWLKATFPRNNKRRKVTMQVTVLKTRILLQ